MAPELERVVNSREKADWMMLKRRVQAIDLEHNDTFEYDSLSPTSVALSIRFVLKSGGEVG